MRILIVFHSQTLHIHNLEASTGQNDLLLWDIFIVKLAIALNGDSPETWIGILNRTTGQNVHLSFISFQISLNCLFPTLWLESSQRGQLSSETKMVHSAWACQRQTLKMGRNQFPKLRSFKLTVSVTICLTLSNVYIFIHENYEKGSTITICMVSEVLA